MAFLWRKRWDSNPRAREGYLISSQARYDHFDTLPYVWIICFSVLYAGNQNNWLEKAEKAKQDRFQVLSCETPRLQRKQNWDSWKKTAADWHAIRYSGQQR